MPQLSESDELHDETHDRSQAAKRRDRQRATLRLCLDEVGAEVTVALQAAALVMLMPVYFSVPSGGALLTFCTPGDLPDEDWERATQIVCDVAGRKLGVHGLTGRPLACVASGASVNATEVSRSGCEPLA
jgi:hypothetical protein